MKRHRSASGTIRALVVAASIVLIVFGVVEQLHTHAPWGPPSETPTLTDADRTDAGPANCLACRAANERGVAVPPAVAAAPVPDGATVVPSPARMAPSIAIDRSSSPRGPPRAPSRSS